MLLGEWYQLIQSNESSAVLKMVNLSHISHWCQILIQKLRDRFVWYLAYILNTLLQLNKSQPRLPWQLAWSRWWTSRTVANYLIKTHLSDVVLVVLYLWVSSREWFCFGWRSCYFRPLVDKILKWLKWVPPTIIWKTFYWMPSPPLRVYIHWLSLQKKIHFLAKLADIWSWCG